MSKLDIKNSKYYLSVNCDIQIKGTTKQLIFITVRRIGDCESCIIPPQTKIQQYSFVSDHNHTKENYKHCNFIQRKMIYITILYIRLFYCELHE